MLQRLPIGFAQLNTYNTYENVPNEICQIINPLYQTKEITKKYDYKKNSIINSMKW